MLGVVPVAALATLSAALVAEAAVFDASDARLDAVALPPATALDAVAKPPATTLDAELVIAETKEAAVLCAPAAAVLAPEAEGQLAADGRFTETLKQLFSYHIEILG